MLIVAKKYSSIDNIIKYYESKQSDQFENDVAKYLNDTYGAKYKLKFESTGHSNSTKADIFIRATQIDDKNQVNNRGQYVECKMIRAQAAHITLDERLTLDERRNENGEVTMYIYTHSKDKEDNKDSEDDEAINTIVTYINEHIKNIKKDHPYLRLGEAYVDDTSDLDETVYSINNKKVQSKFDKAIINHYKNMGVEFIASGKDGEHPLIFKLETFANHFDIKATFRVLPSGSRDVSKMYVKDVINASANSSIEKFKENQFFTGDKNNNGIKHELIIENDKLYIIKDNKKQPVNNVRMLGKSLYMKTNESINDKIPVETHNGKTLYLVFQDPVNGYAKVRISSYKGDNSDRSKPSVNFSLYLKTYEQPKDDLSAFETYLSDLSKLNSETNKKEQ